MYAALASSRPSMLSESACLLYARSLLADQESTPKLDAVLDQL